MKRYVIAGNWKMNFTPAEATSFINEIKPMIEGKNNCDIIFCAPYVTIAAAQEAAKGSQIKIGAENVHFADKGAYTGEVSAKMLTSCGVEYVIIGHSERRQYFGETDETVNLRTKAALAAGMKVILCLGEEVQVMIAKCMKYGHVSFPESGCDVLQVHHIFIMACISDAISKLYDDICLLHPCFFYKCGNQLHSFISGPVFDRLLIVMYV